MINRIIKLSEETGHSALEINMQYFKIQRMSKDIYTNQEVMSFIEKHYTRIKKQKISCDNYEQVFINKNKQKFSPICKSQISCQYKRKDYCFNQGKKWKDTTT